MRADIVIAVNLINKGFFIKEHFAQKKLLDKFTRSMLILNERL